VKQVQAKVRSKLNCNLNSLYEKLFIVLLQTSLVEPSAKEINITSLAQKQPINPNTFL
jgi:hypothetical protein